MQNISIDELVMALRCSARPRKEGDSCVDCPYRLLEEINDDFPLDPDIEEDGVKYWESCNCVQMALDAAEMIEKLNQVPM